MQGDPHTAREGTVFGKGKTHALPLHESGTVSFRDTLNIDG